MTTSTIAKATRVDRAVERLEAAVERLDSALKARPLDHAAAPTDENVEQLQRENAVLRELTQDAADQLGDAIHKLQNMQGMPRSAAADD